MSTQSVFTLEEPSIERLHSKLEYIVSKYNIVLLQCYKADRGHYAVVIATKKEKPLI